MIRVATMEDLDKFSDMARSFSEKAGRKAFNREVFLESWQKLMSIGHGHIYGRFVDNVPCETIAVLTYFDPFEGTSSAEVAFWHFQKEAQGLEGGLLFRQMMEHLKEKGVSQLFFSALLDERYMKVTGFLKSSGFNPVEVRLRKNLCQ